MQSYLTKGKFIALEGFEESNKEDAIELLDDFLYRKGISTVVTEDPGGTALGKLIEDLLKGDNCEITIQAEIFLIMAARIQHVQEVIIPHLEEGTWVISSGFSEYMHAFQCGGAGVDPQILSSLEALAYGSFAPDLIFFLDIPVSVMLDRAFSETNVRVSSDEIEFYKRVRETYLSRLTDNPKGFIVNAVGPSIDINSQLLHQVAFYV